VYQFNGHEYRVVRCTVVQFGDMLTAELYPTPKRHACTWDWRATKQ
jgi:hypothetical protein